MRLIASEEGARKVALIKRFSEVQATNLSGDRGTSIPLVNQATGSMNLSVSLIELEPNAPWGPYHYHARAESVSIILSGHGKLRLNGVEYDLAPEMVVYILPGEAHEMTSVGAEPLRKLDIYSPPRGQDVVEVPWEEQA
jgi:quercetin dioxygenase-like cupin family protein